MIDLINSILMSGHSLPDLCKKLDIDSIKLKGLLKKKGFTPVIKFIDTGKLIKMRGYERFNIKRLAQMEEYQDASKELERIQRGYIKNLVTGSRGKI